MASASSNIISLGPALKIVLVDAKLRIWPRTIPIPLSSDAFNSKTCNREYALIFKILLYHIRKEIPEAKNNIHYEIYFLKYLTNSGILNAHTF